MDSTWTTTLVRAWYDISNDGAEKIIQKVHQKRADSYFKIAFDAQGQFFVIEGRKVDVESGMKITVSELNQMIKLERRRYNPASAEKIFTIPRFAHQNPVPIRWTKKIEEENRGGNLQLLEDVDYAFSCIWKPSNPKDFNRILNQPFEWKQLESKYDCLLKVDHNQCLVKIKTRRKEALEEVMKKFSMIESNLDKLKKWEPKAVHTVFATTKQRFKIKFVMLAKQKDLAETLIERIKERHNEALKKYTLRAVVFSNEVGDYERCTFEVKPVPKALQSLFPKAWEGYSFKAWGEENAPINVLPKYALAAEDPAIRSIEEHASNLATRLATLVVEDGDQRQEGNQTSAGAVRYVREKKGREGSVLSASASVEARPPAAGALARPLGQTGGFFQLGPPPMPGPSGFQLGPPPAATSGPSLVPRQGDSPNLPSLLDSTEVWVSQFNKNVSPQAWSSIASPPLIPQLSSDPGETQAQSQSQKNSPAAALGQQGNSASVPNTQRPPLGIPLQPPQPLGSGINAGVFTLGAKPEVPDPIEDRPVTTRKLRARPKKNAEAAKPTTEKSKDEEPVFISGIANQKAGLRFEKSVDSDIRSHNLRRIRNCMKNGLRMAKFHTVDFEFGIHFGRILMDLPEDKINTKKSFPWEEFDNTIERTKGGLKVDFKDKLTREHWDAEWISDLRMKDSSPMFSSPFSFPVRFIFRALLENEEYLLTVDADTHERAVHRGARNLYGTAYCHFPMHNWDAKLELSGRQSLSPDLPHFKEFFSTIYIQPGKDPIATFILRSDSPLEIIEVLLVRGTRHNLYLETPNMPVGKDIHLVLSEHIRLNLTEKGAKKPDLWRVEGKNRDALRESGCLWYTASLIPEIENLTLDQKRCQEIGKEADWTFEEILGVQESGEVIERLIIAATEVIYRINGVGAPREHAL